MLIRSTLSGFYNLTNKVIYLVNTNRRSSNTLILTLGKLFVEVMASHSFINNSWPRSMRQRQTKLLTGTAHLHGAAPLLCQAGSTEKERKSQSGSMNQRKISLGFILSLFIRLFLFLVFLLFFFPYFPCSQHMQSWLWGSFTPAPVSRQQRLRAQSSLLGRAFNMRPQLQLRGRD